MLARLSMSCSSPVPFARTKKAIDSCWRIIASNDAVSSSGLKSARPTFHLSYKRTTIYNFPSTRSFSTSDNPKAPVDKERFGRFRYFAWEYVINATDVPSEFASELLPYLQTSADKGRSYGQLGLVRHYFTAAPRDLQKAYEYAKLCAENHTDAKKKSGLLIQATAKFFLVNLCILLPGHESEIVPLLQDLITLENEKDINISSAFYLLGALYSEGQYGIERNMTRAVELWQRAAALGESEAHLRLGHYYTTNPEGRTVSSAAQKAFAHFESAAEKGNINAMTWAGSALLDGNGVAQDTSRAATYLERAAQSGDVYAKGHLARMYRKGVHYTRSYEKGFALLREISTSNKVPPFALRLLALCYRDGHGTTVDLQKYFFWLKKASEANDQNAMELLGGEYYNGSVIPQNFVEARRLFGRLLPDLRPHCLALYGYLLIQGLGGEKNVAEGVKCLLSAAERGDAHSQYLLVCSYLRGEPDGSGKMDITKAVHWMMKAEKNKARLEKASREDLEKILASIRGHPEFKGLLPPNS